jgi:two-component system copper resistance phosphate regulon response regulator CusR
MLNILVVEDEKKTAGFLLKGLTENGYAVETADNGEDGLRCALAGNHILVILDIMLPRRDGWSVLKELRRAGKQTPVLFLTARDAIPDRVKGLELGADDYLVKPFAFSELLARVRSVLRRSKAHRETLQVADLSIDLMTHRVWRGDQVLELAPKEFALLTLLARRSGEVLTRPLIAKEVWEMTYEGETNVVDVQVRRLRAKVDDSFERKLIHTVRGVGYVLENRP